MLGQRTMGISVARKGKRNHHHVLTVRTVLLGKQHINISEWCSATFIVDVFDQFGGNLGENHRWAEQ